MGELIRFVSSHEVGHTLGLRGASSATPVEKLRDKEYQEKTDILLSWMHVFQLCCAARRWGDCFIPRIGDYDKWAIKWGIPILKTLKTRQEKVLLNEMTKEAYKNNRLWFGSETSPYDPRYQTEDPDNAMRASEYGIKT
jgi:hypothetical protein